MSVGLVAMPDAFVVAVAVVEPPKPPEAPLPGVVNVTVTPETGLPSVSFTSACSVEPKLVFTMVVCDPPLCAATDPGTAAVLVREKLGAVTGVVLLTLALTETPPAAPTAVNTVDVAFPELSVTTVTEARPPANVALAPTVGALKVTDAPGMTLLLASFTTATSTSA